MADRLFAFLVSINALIKTKTLDPTLQTVKDFVPL